LKKIFKAQWLLYVSWKTPTSPSQSLATKKGQKLPALYSLAKDRPDIVCRVFSLKVKQIMDHLTKREYFW